MQWRCRGEQRLHTPPTPADQGLPPSDFPLRLRLPTRTPRAVGLLPADADRRWGCWIRRGPAVGLLPAGADASGAGVAGCPVLGVADYRRGRGRLRPCCCCLLQTQTESSPCRGLT